jgi:hypothetical protein
MLLSATTQSLELDLSGAVATNQLPVTVSYVDINQSTFAMSAVTGSTTQSNDTTAVTIVSAPGASTTRQIKSVSIKNSDTAAVTLWVQINDNSTLREIIKPTLAVGDTLFYTDTTGWATMDSTGRIKFGAGVNGPGSATDNAVPRWDGTGGTVLQNSSVIIDDSNNVTGIVGLGITNFTANWTNAGRTVADLGIVTTVDINGGTLDGVTIGGASAGAGSFTTLGCSGNASIGDNVADAHTITGAVTITDDSASGLHVARSGSGDKITLGGTAAGSGAIIQVGNSGSTDYEPLELIGESVTLSYRTGVNLRAAGITLNSSGNTTLAGTLAVGDGTSTIGTGGTGVTLARLNLNGGSGVAAGSGIYFRKNTVNKGFIGNESVIAGSGTSDDTMIFAETGFDVHIAVNGSVTPVVTVSGTTTTLAGTLAVNGASITTDDTTFAVFNTTATTVNAFGAASTALNIGNASGTNTVSGATNFNQAVTGDSTISPNMGNSGTFSPAIGKATVDTTAVGNVDGGEDTLITYDLPADALSAAGKGVRITAWGTTRADANAKVIRGYFGSTTCITINVNVSSGAAKDWKIVIEVFSTGTDAQKYYASYFDTSGAAYDQGSMTENDGAAITIKCTGASISAVTDSIIQEGLLVEYFG